MNELKFGPIEEKLESVNVEGQSSWTCLHDCERYYYSGNSSSSPVGCTVQSNVDAYKSVEL